MATIEPEVDLALPEFTALRDVLARPFLRHRTSMGLGDASDEWILDHVDDICLMLVELTKHAVDIDDRAWLRRHVWWRLLAHQLRNELSTDPRRMITFWQRRKVLETLRSRSAYTSPRRLRWVLTCSGLAY
jgi:hypothetical protein